MMMHSKNHMLNVVDRAAARLYPVSTAGGQGLQVELDLGPVLRSTGPGPSPLSSSSSFGASLSTNCPPTNSCITIVAGECTMQPHLKNNGRMPSRTHILWRQKAEDALWLASAFFILFYGDFRSNFFSLLASDPRIARVPLVYGTACVLLNCMILLLLLVARSHLKRSGTRVQSSRMKVQNLEEYITAAASAVLVVVGVAAFVMLSIALWPVWYILTFPLLFTLFMALVVLISYAALLPWNNLMIAQDIACTAHTNKEVLNAWSLGNNLRSSFKE